MLSRHLRRAQREERRLQRLEKGEGTEEASDIERETPEERELLDGGISRVDAPMTPAVACSLILESLSINRLESLEGMSKCYDGIVAAGMAIIDSQTQGPTSPVKSLGGSKSGPSRSEILSALAPLLITSLEQPSGDVILMLAKLRRMCGTFRYQRRFVQRVAPLLIRPPRGAIWCLRHQQDMEAILAAAELIFDSAFDIFSKGWHERGQLLLADSKRAKTLDSAAKQLRSLSHEPAGTFSLGLSGHGSHKWMTAKKRKDAANASNEPLAEWEVVAVVRQIKVSISSVMNSDWSRVAAQSDVPRPYRRPHTGRTNRSVLQTSALESNPSSISSPRSPGRPITYGRAPQSPPHLPSVGSTGASENIDNAFPTFNSQMDRAASPPPPAGASMSPPMPHRTTKDLEAGKSDTYGSSTPPKSPKSPIREKMASLRTSETVPSIAPLSPKRGKTTGGIRETLAATAPGPTTTPLSPSASSVGTSGSGELVSYRPSSASNSSTASTPSATTNYRTLTSTAAERRRTVAACRALRAQIQRFEDAFIRLHGRPPKGATERAPLATTYAQYREWKRAIRADAACRIQALLRGAHTRSKLLRMNSATLSRIIMKRPGRPGYDGADSIINQISIPVEIGEAVSEGSPTSAGAAPTAATATDSFGGSSGPALAPQWASTIRRRSNSGDRAAGDNMSNASPSRRSYAPPAAGSPNSSASSDLSNLSLDELQSRKRELKRQLKQYDIAFARRNGRMPVKAEKEPIRHLYESYNALKSQISVAENESRAAQSASTVASQSSTTVRASNLSPRTDSPSVGSDSGHSGEDSPSRGSSLLPNRAGRRRVPRDTSSPPIAAASAELQRPGGNPGTQDLQSLRAEKTRLHQMLRSYEREFFEEHRRQVSSFSDIRPVAAQYRRYKEIKRAIAALQASGER